MGSTGNLLSHFATAARLSPLEQEAVLMASLQRMAAWVSNLPLEGHLVYSTALVRGIAIMEQLPPDVSPATRLARGLWASFETLADALCRLQVGAAQGGPKVGHSHWGSTSASVWGWANAQGLCQVWVAAENCRVAPAGLPWLLLGRVLSGATLDWLEQQESIQDLLAEGAQATTPMLQVTRPTVSGNDAESFRGQICHAIRSLVKRGVWNLKIAQGRIFLCQDQLMLLWPLGGRDLFNERQGQESPFARPLSESAFVPMEPGWREQLIRCECLIKESEDGIVEAWHPLWKRFVRAVRIAPGLAALCGVSG
jgi:hypothetical protein